MLEGRAAFRKGGAVLQRTWSGWQDAEVFSGAGPSSERIMVSEHFLVSV